MEIGSVEKGVPLSAQTRKKGAGRRSPYPFTEMDVGDSFPVRDVKGQSLSTAINRAHKQYQCKFAIRPQDDGSFRVWRVA